MRKIAPLPVELPTAAEDKPSWLGVGVVAAIGFVVGVAWPRAAGVRFAPHAPGTQAAPQAESATSTQAANAALAPKAKAEAAGPGAAASLESPPPSRAPSAATPIAAGGAGTPVTVKAIKGNVLSCRNAAGESLKGRECGLSAGLDGFAKARLERLERCPALVGKSGKLSVVVTADYAAGNAFAELGKSTSIGDAAAVAQCVRGVFQGTRLDGVKHQNVREVVAYSAQVDGGATASPDAPSADVPAAVVQPAVSPTAPVTWEVALVRDAPKTGAVIARLPRGTQVELGESQGGWYRITSGDVKGWVYRGALGR